MKGTESKQVGTISLNCISPEARCLLDTIMAEWEKHKKDFHKIFPKKRLTVYSFAYWLIRWSNLVQPSEKNSE